MELRTFLHLRRLVWSRLTLVFRFIKAGVKPVNQNRVRIKQIERSCLETRVQENAIACSMKANQSWFEIVAWIPKHHF